MGKIIDHNNFWYIEKNPISKTGVFPYLGREIGFPGLEPNKIYYVLRSEQELMSPEAIKSFELLPITKGHRMLGPQDQGLTPAEKIPQQGVVGEKVFADGDTLYANIKVTSEQAKNDINNGLKELSLGYFCRWVKEAGEYKGRHYDFAQKNIRGNHLAIVPLGRMGHDVRVMDALPAGAGSYACDSLELAGPFVSAPFRAGATAFKVFSLPGQAQDWQESDHPRKKDGKFAPKGQGESGKAKNEEKTESSPNHSKVFKGGFSGRGNHLASLVIKKGLSDLSETDRKTLSNMGINNKEDAEEYLRQAEEYEKRQEEKRLEEEKERKRLEEEAIKESEYKKQEKAGLKEVQELISGKKLGFNKYFDLQIKNAPFFDLKNCKPIMSEAEALAQLELLAGNNIYNAQTGLPAQVNSNQRGKLISEKALNKSLNNGFTNEEHNTAAANVNKLYEVAILEESREYTDEFARDMLIRRYVANISTKNGDAYAKLTVKASKQNLQRIYSVELENLERKPLKGGRRDLNPPSTLQGLTDSISESEDFVKDLESLKKEELSDMSIPEMLENAEDGMNLFIEEAAHAGDDWDESKHKRDAEGKFTSGGGATEIKRKQEERAAKKAEIERRAGKFEAGAAYKKAMENNPNDEQAARVAEARSLSRWSKTAYANPQSAKSVFFTRASQNDYIKKMDRGWLEDIFNSVKGTKTNGTDGISAAPEDKESIKMDKRKVIEEIMAIAAKPADEFKDGKEEQIKTIAGLAEKLAYNKSGRGANDEDAAKDKDKAKDEDNPSKTDKDADKEAKKACDKADKAEDAMEARIAANFAKKAALYEKVSPFTGSFDHNPMTLSQMAKYACDKLGIKGVAEDGAQTALEGYLVGAQKQAVVRQAKGASMDAAPESDAAFENYLKEAE